MITITLAMNHIVISVFIVLIINNRHFLPYRRADLTVSALLQRICGRRLQLHPLRLAPTQPIPTATSTRE